ncbi:unnamed protein product [Blepharisma stoltei]|uniref:Uncharacterized protein n=1 Tax=Blepharisma stoltei TaxID=1481888 RepID=A0AAU9JLB6_9CILI|nr:unnamed protein product [Blepharisma stoltei]
MKISPKVGSLSPLRLYRNQNPFFPPTNHDSIRSFPKILLRNSSNDIKLHRNFLTEKCKNVKDLKKSYILTPKGLESKDIYGGSRELSRYSKSSRLFHYSPLMSIRRPKLKERSMRFLINETDRKISEFLSEASSPVSKPETPIQKLKGSPKKLSERRFRKLRLKHIGVVDEGVQAFEDSPRDYFDEY